MRTIAEQCKDHGSQGSKVVTCVRCQGEIKSYAGRRVAAYREAFAHHPGQCADYQDRLATMRGAADQPGLFAWNCTHIEPAGDLPMMCNELSDDREAFAAHMREHGAAQLRPSVQPVKLRKSSRPPAPKFAPVDLASVFKRVAWVVVDHLETGERHPAELGGGPVYREVRTEHRGQFWSAGAGPHSIVVIEDLRATGRPNRLVELYAHGDGTWSEDWSRAKWDRRHANAAAKRAA